MASYWQNLRDNFIISAMHSPLGGGGLARAYYRAKGYSNDQINHAIDAETTELQARHKNDHGFVNGATSLLGSVLGGVNPAYAVGGGGTGIVSKAARMAAVQAPVSVASQAVDVGTGMRNRIDPNQVVADMRNAALFGAGGHVAGKVAGKVVSTVKPYLHASEVQPVEPNLTGPPGPDGLPTNGSVRPIDPKVMAKIMNDPEAAGATGINDNVPNRRMNNRDVIHDDDLEALPPANKEYVEQQLAQTPPPEAIHDSELTSPDAPTTIHDSQLTPAEAQEMDASAPKPVVPDTYGEVPYEAPSAPANDTPKLVPGEYGINPDADPYAGMTPEDQAAALERSKGMGASQSEYAASIGGEPVAPSSPANDADIGSVSEGRIHGPFEEHPTDDPDGNKYLTYTTNAGDKLPIKMGIDDGTAEIAVDQFGTGANKLGPAEIRQAMYHLQDMYPEIQKFGGYRRSGAGAGRVQEIAPPPREAPTASPEQDPLGAATAEADQPQGGFIRQLMDNEEGMLGGGYRKNAGKPKLSEIPDEELTPEQRVVKAIHEAQPIRNQQADTLREDRARKAADFRGVGNYASGEAGANIKMSKLEGTMEQLPSGAAIRSNLSQDEIDGLFDRIENHPSLGVFDQAHAITGLKKLLGNSQQPVPTNTELSALRTVFEQSKDPKINMLAGILNAPKTIQTSYDLSAPLRQGGFMVGRKEFYTALAPMVHAFVSPDAEARVNQTIFSNPLYAIKERSGLSLPDPRSLGNGGPPLSSHEENYQSFASKIPLVGIGIRASERAYNTFIYKLRSDVFDTLYKAGMAQGKQWNAKSTASLSDMINTFTGRGDLGKFNNLAPALNMGLYSPRLLASRIKILGLQDLNPASKGFYRDMDPFVRKEAFKQVAAWMTAVTTTLGLAKFAGAEVGGDPRDPDGWKIKVGNIRHDIMGGEKQLIRLVGNVTTYMYDKGKEVATTGEIKLSHNDRTAADNIGTFMRDKESPDMSFVHDVLAGNTAVGEDFNIKDAATSRLLPMVPQDTYDVVKELNDEGVPADKKMVEALAHSLPDVFGDSVQVYKPKEKKTSSGSKKDFGNDFSGDFGSDFGKDF